MTGKKVEARSERGFSWKDVPQIFANRNFGMEKNGVLERWTVFNGNIIWWCHSCGSQGMWIHAEIKKCTLIARKIEDMTDEEFSFLHDKNWKVDYPNGKKEIIEFYEKLAFQNILSSGMMIDMISIGVYPFDQSHFETGEVIDIKEVEAQS